MIQEHRILSAITGRLFMILRMDDEQQYFFNPVLGQKVFIVDPETPFPRGTNVSDTTTVAGDVLSGKAFYLADGTKTNGTITSKAAQTYTPGTVNQTIAAGQYLAGIQKIKGDAKLIAANIKKNVTIFGVTGNFEGSGTDVSDTTAAAGDVLSGKAFYLANGTKTNGTISSKAAQTYTPGTSDQTIAAGQYLSGVQTIKGAAGLVADNIRKDVTIFGVTGTYTGSSGGDTFTVVRVKSYNPAWDEFISFAVSGLTDHSGDDGPDLTAANGTYTVTSGTDASPEKDRVYKHSSANYFIYFYSDPENAANSCWCLATSPGSEPMSALLTDGTTLEAGTKTWNGEWGYSDSLTIANVTSVHHDTEIVVNKATAYDASLDSYTFSPNNDTLSQSQTTPRTSYLYLRTGNMLTAIIGSEYGNYVTEYIVNRSSPDEPAGQGVYRIAALVGYDVWTSGGSWTMETHGNIDVPHLGNGCYATFSGTSLPASTQYSLCAAFWCDSSITGNTRIISFGSFTSGENTPLCIYLNRSTNTLSAWCPAGGAYINKTSTDLASGWHHAVITYDTVSHDVKLYLDGAIAGTANKVLSSVDNRVIMFGAYGDGNGGCECELKVLNTVMTQAMVTAEYTRVSALCG